MGRYTLRIDDNITGKQYDIKLEENGHMKNKVDLMTIDRFIGKRYIGNDQYEKFTNKEELKNYLSKFFNKNISDNFDAYIYYISNKEQQKLELVYDDKVIEYFSQMFIYYNNVSRNYDEVGQRVANNIVWRDFSNMFKTLINDNHFYNYIISTACEDFITPSFRTFIIDYHNNSNTDRIENIYDKDKADINMSNYLISYKVIRGVQLCINRYNNIKNQCVGLGDEYLDNVIYQQNQQMPISETVYYGKNEKVPVTMYQTTDEELNANIGGGYTSKGDLAEKLFEEEGMTLDEVLANKELAIRLGYIEEEVIDEPVTRRRHN